MTSKPDRPLQGVWGYCSYGPPSDSDWKCTPFDEIIRERDRLRIKKHAQKEWRKITSIQTTND